MARERGVTHTLAEIYPAAFRCGAFVEAGALMAGASESEYIYLRADTGLRREGLLLRQPRAVFIDQTVAGERKVLCGLTMSRAGVDIAAYEPRRCRGHEQTPVLVLSDKLIGGGKVGDHSRPGEAQPRRFRNGRPQILAYLHADDEVLHLAAAEKHFQPEGHDLAAKLYIIRPRVISSGGELAHLIEFGIVRQHGLRHDTENVPVMQQRGAVIKLSLNAQRNADGGNAALPGRISAQGA